MATLTSVKLVAVAVIIPYLLGWFLSSNVLPDEHFLLRYLTSSADPSGLQDTSKDPIPHRHCSPPLESILHKPTFQNFSLVVHRNGEADECGQVTFDWEALVQATASLENCPNDLNKFDVESLITRLIGSKMSDATCQSDLRRALAKGFLGFCDRGEDKTPILLDHNDLVSVPTTHTLPCRFHIREGVRITSLLQLQEYLERSATECSSPMGENANTCLSAVKDGSTMMIPQLHVYAVPAGRVFMFAPNYVGEIFDLPHVHGADGLSVSLEVLSLSPVVMDIYNFFSRDESDDLVQRALSESKESHRIKRSTTGAGGKDIHMKRTSENGFDTHGRTSMTVKKRCFEILGFDEYLEGHADGLQILRYNLTTAYIPHLDWIDDPSGQLKHDYDSSGTGGNRFATILLYMSDLDYGDGGETVFTHGWPVGQPEEEHVEFREARDALRASGDAALVLKEGSWEEEMVARCRSRLSIRPNSARAVLFYSQLPTGEPDNKSQHGGCPVLKGEKWAANLWVWNTPRDGFDGSPIKAKFAKQQQEENTVQMTDPTPQFTTIKAVFKNSGNDATFERAQLYFDSETFWGALGHGDPALHVNTYEGHKWDIKVDGTIVKSWIIRERKGVNQVFEL